MKFSEFLLYVIYAASALFAVYVVVDLLTEIFSGNTIEEIMSGESGIAVSLIIDNIPYLSPPAFVLVSLVVLVVLSAIIALLVTAMIYPLLKQKATGGKQ